MAENFNLVSTYIKYLKSSNIQHTNKILSWQFGVQLLVNTDNHPQEQLLIDRLAESPNSIVNLQKVKYSKLFLI